MSELRDLVRPQPAPVPRPGGASMHDVAAALHALRKAHGLGTYNSLLQAGNGRRALVDKLQEDLDGLVYAIQGELEAQALGDALAMLRVNLAEVAGRDGDERAPGAAWALRLFDEVLAPGALAAATDDLAQVLIFQAGEVERS